MDIQDWQKQLRGYTEPLLKITLAMLFGLFIFEVVKDVLAPDMTRWQSHSLTIIFGTILAVTASFFILYREYARHQLALEENTDHEKIEEDLRRNKEWFRSLTEHGSDLITVIDPNGTILYDSPSIERILGYRPIDRQGKSGFDLVHPEDIPGARSIIQRAFQHLGSTHTIEMRVRGLDGRWHVLEATGKAMLDHDGKLRGIINSRDITERKRIEGALALFRSLIDHTNDTIEIIDAETGRFLDVNEKACLAHGYTREEYLSLTVAEIDPLVAARPWKELREQTRRDGFLIIESQHRRKDGSVFPVEVNATYIRLDRDYILAVVRDITERKQLEAAVRKSEQQLRLLLDSTGEGIYGVDLNGNCTFINPSATQMLGRAPEEILGKHIHELIHHSRPDGSLYPTSECRMYKAYIAGQGYHADDEVFWRRDGTSFPVHYSSFPLIENGVVLGAVAVFTDITERKQAHQAIKVLAKFPEENPHPILRVAQDGTLLYANAASHALLEMWHCLPDKPIPERWRNLVVRALASGQPHTTEADIGNQVYSFTIAPIANENYANIYASDITARKQAEEALRQKEEYFRSLIENVQDIITILNPDGTMTYESPSVERMMGYKPEELVGRSAFEFIHEEDRPHVLEALQQVVGNPGSTASAEFRFQGKDGAWRHLESVGKSLAGVSGSLSVIVTSRDITERKQLELKARQLSRLAALGQLIGGIAHELKNPLFILTGRTQMAREKLAQQEYADLGSDLEIIGDVGHRMKTITDRFVAIAKPVPPRQEPCSVQAILHKSLESLANELTQNRIRVETAFAPDLPGIQSDPRQLHEVFLNLMQNAVQAMTHVPGERRLTVSAAREGTWVVARIQDNGPGIAPEHRARLFEPFFSTAAQGERPGLGLWIVRSTLMMLRGEVLCESEVGKGTTFIVRMPVST